MKHAWMLMLLLIGSAHGSPFAECEDLDLFIFLNNTHAGLSNRPYSSAAVNEKAELVKRLNSTGIQVEEIRRDVKHLVEKNAVGLVYYSAAMGYSKHWHDYLACLPEFLGKDERKNFVILYGAKTAYACATSRMTGQKLGMSQKSKESLDDVMMQILNVIHKNKLPIAKTPRYPDIIKYIRSTYDL